jgi:ligand-binding sensor domain-containing protein
LLCASPPVRAERLPLKAYTTAEGLAHNVVTKIVRDSRGFLWFCTSDGLSRFDGYTFMNFGTDQGLPHASVTDLLETRSGEYWVATYGGVVRFNPKGTPANRVVYDGEASVIAPMFTVTLSEDQDRRARAITVLLEDRNGAIWCGTQKGLSRLERINNRIALRSVDIGIPNEYPEQGIISELLEDRYGTVWIAAPSGLYRRWPDGNAARYTKRDGLPSEYLQDLLEDHEGHLWAGTRLGGFFRFNADDTHSPPVVAQAFTIKDGLPTTWVFQLFESSDRRFWVATGRGLVEFFPNGNEHGQRFRSYTTRNGLSYHDITALNEDLGGNLWLGTNTAWGASQH